MYQSNILYPTRSLSSQESRVVLTLAEQEQREVTRQEIVQLLGISLTATDHVIHSLRRKGWLERASWGKYLLINPDQGPEVLGEGNLLALASCITDPYYIGFSTAAAHYGFTTQHRNVIYLITPNRLRNRQINDTLVQVINPAQQKFFGFTPVDVLGYEVFLSDREKTVIDCIDRPELAGGIGEVAYILGTASRRFDWEKLIDYLEKLKSCTLVRRLGWLLDYVKAETPSVVRNRLIQLAGKGRRTIFGHKKRLEGAIGNDDTWRLFVNITKEELHGNAGLGAQRTVRKGK